MEFIDSICHKAGLRCHVSWWFISMIGGKEQSNLLQMKFMYVIKITTCEISPNKGIKIQALLVGGWP